MTAASSKNETMSSPMEATEEGRNQPGSGPSSVDKQEVELAIGKASSEEARPAQSSVNDKSQSGSVAMPSGTSRICGVCEKQPGKYKCSRCTMPFCSVACSWVHQEGHSCQPVAPKLATLPTPGPDASRKQDPIDPYSALLDHTTHFQKLFQRYPGLESRLVDIHDQTLPPEDLKKIPGMGGGIQWHSGQGGRQGRKPEPWTREVGLRKGAAALRKARTDPTELGDGVREYCELVLQILSKPELDDVAAIVRSEVAQGDTKVVERLLREDER